MNRTGGIIVGCVPVIRPGFSPEQKMVSFAFGVIVPGLKITLVISRTLLETIQVSPVNIEMAFLRYHVVTGGVGGV
jgi:hypothetical protein